MSARPILTAEDIRHAHRAGLSFVQVPPGAIVTQQAREDARHHSIELVAAQQSATLPVKPESTSASPEKNLPKDPTKEQAKQLLETGRALLRMAAQMTGHETGPASTKHLVPLMPASKPAVPASVPSSAIPSPTEKTTCTCKNGDEALFTRIRTEVMAALPAGIPTSMVDELIRKTLASQKMDGGGCLHCPNLETSVASGTQNGWLTEAHGVRRVDSKALHFDSGSRSGATGLMQVLAEKDEPQVGYVQLNGGHMDWVFEQAEVVVVLEGQLRVRVADSVLQAAPGDVCTFPAGASVTFEADGPVRFTSVSTGAA